MALNNVLKVTSNAELMSYIINVTPELSTAIDLPKQGESIAPIGSLIMNNKRYRNAFINTINLIGLTVIKRNGWDNPWDFTNRGNLNWGQQIREIIVDLAKVYDYNEKFDDKTFFTKSFVPDVYNYIHEVNFQKFYASTTSDRQMAMAFDSEGGLLDFIETVITNNYESWMYDKFIIDKYMLCRRYLNGTMCPTTIEDFDNITPRERVEKIKAVSNKMSFRSPNYNPAGVRRATRFDDQILIVNSEYEAQISTSVLATSFFKDEAELKARLVLVDSFSSHDENRLAEVLGGAFVPFTETEKASLETLVATLVSREWFMDYYYSMNADSSDMASTDFYNPTTLENNHFLHVWAVFSTSPYENCAAFTKGDAYAEITGITPSESTVTAGFGSIQLKANVVSYNGGNEAVLWSIDETTELGLEGKIFVDNTGLVTCTDPDVTGTAVIKATLVDKASAEAHRVIAEETATIEIV